MTTFNMKTTTTTTTGRCSWTLQLDGTYIRTRMTITLLVSLLCTNTNTHMFVVTPCSPVGVGHGELVHVRQQRLAVMEGRERGRASAKRAVPRLPPCQSAYSAQAPTRGEARIGSCDYGLHCSDELM